MKIKARPSDFQVVELSDVEPSSGSYALYELSKTSLGTPEAIQIILRRWRLPRKRISYGGLKDRHAQTTQLVTVFEGPQRDLCDRSFTLRYLGRTPQPFTAQQIRGNRFCITLRAIDPSRRGELEQRWTAIQQDGVVNYFDDQRFGSVGESGRFVAVPWCLGDYEQVLFLALAEANSHDRPRERQQKEILRRLWGQWSECKAQLDRSHRRSIVTYLVDHPTDFKRAVGLIRSDLRSLYVAAFQSAVWNRWLSRIIETRGSSGCGWIDWDLGKLAVPRATAGLGEAWGWLRELSLPLPSARQHDWPEEYVALLDQVLADYSLSRRQIRLKYPRDTFFSKGFRSCWLAVSASQHSWVADELHPGCWALRLEWTLPRGAYATMVLKMLQAD